MSYGAPCPRQNLAILERMTPEAREQRGVQYRRGAYDELVERFREQGVVNPDKQAVKELSRLGL